MIFGRTMLQVLTQSDDKKDKKENDDQKLHKRKAQEERKVRLMDLRISCLLFLTFSNVVFTEMSAFYYVKLIFLNCSIFASFLFLSLNQA